MSLAAFEKYLSFVDQVLGLNEVDLPSAIDLAELESTLVSHGVVLLYAHTEQCFRQVVETKCRYCIDDEVRAFALSVKDEKTGKIGMGEVKGTLKRFGVACRDGFKEDLEKLDAKESWDSVMNHRHTVAHQGDPASLTLATLKEYYSGIQKILGLICKALGLDQKEVAKISSLIELPSPETAVPSSAEQE